MLQISGFRLDSARERLMTAKLSEGDTIGATGEVTLVHDDGSLTMMMAQVTIRLHGFGCPITLRAKHLSLVAK
jgi:hypothetical protein